MTKHKTKEELIKETQKLLLMNDVNVSSVFEISVFIKKKLMFNDEWLKTHKHEIQQDIKKLQKELGVN